MGGLWTKFPVIYTSTLGIELFNMIYKLHADSVLKSVYDCAICES
jgi:hypothetical protein